jgi:hypothetical protein
VRWQGLFSVAKRESPNVLGQPPPARRAAGRIARIFPGMITRSAAWAPRPDIMSPMTSRPTITPASPSPPPLRAATFDAAISVTARASTTELKGWSTGNETILTHPPTPSEARRPRGTFGDEGQNEFAGADR